MRKIRLMLTVAAVSMSALMASTAQAAPATQASARSALNCSTWQYITDPGMPIYYGAGDGTGRKDTTRNQGFVNVTSIVGDWRGGNFYTDPGPVWYTSGWIHISHVHYVGCW